jgi:adenosylmethionine-8-amino-7-oxononanoate aminotransferase
LPAIIKGNGALLIDNQGKKYIDAISSWWVNLHGHGQKHIAKKIAAQAKKMEHVAFSDFTHEPAVMLAKRLLKHLPSGQKKIFYSDNGSTAVEVALKMAIQYHSNTGKPKKTFIAFENGYHGDTFGSMSVAERNVFNGAFSPFLFDVLRIPLPLKGKEKESLHELKLHLKRKDICAFIFEPLILGAGGMLMYEAEQLNKLITECKKNACITIADEVMTGFGRTGNFFATNSLTEQPDIICLSKGITGGFLPLGVTSCNNRIHEAFTSDDKTHTFYHGHSYTANPIACAAANASLDLLEKNETAKQIKMITTFFTRMKEKIMHKGFGVTCRQTGTVLAIEFHSGKSEYLNPISAKIKELFFERGIFVRPLGNVLYFMPPYCITMAQLRKIEKCTIELLQQRNLTRK